MKKFFLMTVLMVVSASTFAANPSADSAASNFGAIGSGFAAISVIGLGILAFGVVSGIARNPGAEKEIFKMAIIIAGMIEGVAIFGVVVGLLANFTDTSAIANYGAVGAGIASIAMIGLGILGNGAVNAISRQPGSAALIFKNTIIIAGMIEGVAIFGVVVGLLAVFS